VMLGLVPQLLLYKYLYGHFFALPQGRYYVQPTHAHPWLVLFAPKGLFFYAPVAWLAVAGAALAGRRHPLRPVLLATVAAVAAEVWAASIPLDWNGSGASGARRLISALPLLGLLAARALDPLVNWVGASRTRVEAIVVSAVLLPLGFMFVGVALTSGEKDNTGHYSGQADTYGDSVVTAWARVDRAIGPVALLPALGVFVLRYGLPHESYWEVLDVRWYVRDYRSMTMRDTVINVKDEGARRAMTGFTPAPDGGMTLSRPRGTLVVATHWPFATNVVVVGRAARDVTVRIGSRGFFGKRSPFGTMRLSAGRWATTTLPVPPGGFDSGVNEFTFETDDVTASFELTSFEMKDTTSYPPAI
jgi:hypothetical protein